MRAGFFSELETTVRDAWAHLGEQITPSGTRCIAHVPQVGRAAWLHSFYAGCPARELDAAERRMGRAIPPSWREALLAQNGLMLFLDSIALDGILPGGLLRRSIEDSQPFSLEDSNGLERPRGPIVAAEDFVIGGSALGSGSVYLLRADDSVVKVPRDGIELLAAWESAEDMLATEYAAVAACYDHDGTYRGA